MQKGEKLRVYILINHGLVPWLILFVDLVGQRSRFRSNDAIAPGI